MLDGRSWTIAEVPQDGSSSHQESQSTGFVGGSRLNVDSRGVARPDPPAVVHQHLQIDRQFVIINSKVIKSSLIIAEICCWHYCQVIHCL